MPFSRSLYHFPPYISLHSVPLDLTDQYKYLGLILTPNLYWSLQIHNIVASATHNLGYTRRTSKASPPNLKRILYTTFARRSQSAYQPDRINFSIDYSSLSRTSTMKSCLAPRGISTRRLSSRLSLLYKVCYTPSPYQSLLPPSYSYTSHRADHDCKIG